MKKIILALSLIFVSASFVTSQAQHINININSQPAWGPVGYDYVDYYYIPEINVYYNVPSAVFYYMDRGRWISARYLPYSYRDYNLYGMYKVVLNTRDPWHYNRHHVRDYARYRNIRNQHVIYYAKDRRYNHSRRNTVAWYKGGKHNAPPKYKDNNRHSKPGNRESYGHNYGQNNRKDRIDNNRIQNNNRNNNSRPDRERSTRSPRNSSSDNKNSRQQPTTRSSQSYMVNNASKNNESSSRSSSRSSSSRSQSERTSSTRSNR